jgi:hypothetical protein
MLESLAHRDPASSLFPVASRSVDRAGRGRVRELPDGIRDPAPDGHAVVIASGCEFVGAQVAFLERSLAVRLSIRVAARQMSISEITP